MPRTHALDVVAGDRLTLLQYALTSRLVEIEVEGRNRRGAPVLPLDLTGKRGSRWWSNLLFARPPVAETARSEWLAGCQELVERIERNVTEDEPPLRDLLHNIEAASAPHLLTRGVVDGRFWPSLRRLGVSRHPVDLVITGYCAVNHLLRNAGSPPESEQTSPRDQRAVERLLKGLCLLAQGSYPFNSSALNLISVLCWWSPETVRKKLDEPAARRLCRPLDRAVRTNMRTGVSLDDPARRAFFAVMVAAAARVTRPPHTATSSSSPALRFARIVLMRHPSPHGVPGATSPAYDGTMVRTIVTNLAHLARGLEGSTDVLLRREAAWYLLEAEELVDPVLDATRHEMTVEVTIRRLALGAPDVFGDLLAMRTVLAGRRQVSPPTKPRATWGDNYDDFARDRDLTVDLWLDTVHRMEPAAPSWLPLLEQYASPVRVPRTTAWRAVTKQVAVPTMRLLFESLVTPWSARALWVVGAFKAAGPHVVAAAVDSLEQVLAAAVAPGSRHDMISKRAAWMLGQLTPATESTLKALRDVAMTAGLSGDVTADAVWAMGDILAGLDDAAMRPEVEDCFRHLVDVAVHSLTDSPPDDAEPYGQGPLVVAQAAFHALAIQLRPGHAEFINSRYTQLYEAYRAAEASDAYTSPGRPQYYLRQLKATREMARWALHRMDADVALAID